MMAHTETRRFMRILITVKTYPIPSDTYDELVCTAGVTADGDFIRLYPINFRDLDDYQQYKKYQWIEVEVEKHGRRDSRKESYRPVGDIRVLGEPINPNPGNWKERAKYALKNSAESMEALREVQDIDRTSLGVFKPKHVHDLVVSPDDPDWKPEYLQELKQMRIWETRKASRRPLRKVPFKFHYKFNCDDEECTGHRMSIHDWEVGALFWGCVDRGDTHSEAAAKVKHKFLFDICGPDKDTYFFVGTVHGHPKSWIVLGTFYPKAESTQFELF